LGEVQLVEKKRFTMTAAGIVPRRAETLSKDHVDRFPLETTEGNPPETDRNIKKLLTFFFKTLLCLHKLG
jgi:hypothetical protein